MPFLIYTKVHQFLNFNQKHSSLYIKYQMIPFPKIENFTNFEII